MDIQQLKFLSSRGRKIQQLLKTNTPPESESASKISNEKIDNNSGQDFSQEALPVIQNEIPLITPVPEGLDEMINPFVANDSQSVHDGNIISSSSLQINEMDIEYYVVDETTDNNSGKDLQEALPVTPVPESQDEMINPFVANDSQSVHDGNISSSPLQLNEMDIEYYVVAEEYGDGIDSEAQSLTYTVLTTNSNLQPAHDGSIDSVLQTNEMNISVAAECEGENIVDDESQSPAHIKRKKDGQFSRKRKAEKYQKRNAGKSYSTLAGKVIKARETKPLGDCRAKCRERLSQLGEVTDLTNKIFNEYWSLGSRDRRVSFVAGLVESTEPAVSRKRTDDPEKAKCRMVSHSFFFLVNGNRIKFCRGCFMKVLDETQMFITLAITNRNTSVSGSTGMDMRGRDPSVNKVNEKRLAEIHSHINSFPAYESHYTRRKSNRKFLPSFLNLTKMYSLYRECSSDPVSRVIYEREFHSLNISFKSPKVDTCHKCDVLQMKLKLAEDEAKIDIKKEIDLHHREADLAYTSKDSDKKNSQADSSKRCYTFDLQQCLPTPFLNTSVSFYKRQLWTYNVTVHNTSDGEVNCFMWHEAEGARGANQIATCLFREISSMPESVKNVTLYSDSCGGQNRNSHVSAMFLYLMQQNMHVETIDHKFMVSGHSHLECDVDHGLIEKQKKKLQIPISHPHDWYQLVRSVGKKGKFKVIELTHVDFLDFADLFKTTLTKRMRDTDNNPFKWTEIRWLCYTKEKQVVHFKCSLELDAPFRKMNFKRRRHVEDINPGRCYTSTLAISREKKNDILDLLPLIPPAFHDFYRTMKTSSEARNILPDIEEFNEDGSGA